MATTTTNLGLVKPAYPEAADIAVINTNMDIIDASLPIGTVFDFAGTVIPPGWLECNGQAVSRTTYSKLFAAIGTTWGAGDGSTTFSVPNFCGRVSIGSDSSYSVGATGGEKSHTLSTSEMPSHTHAQNAHSHGQDAHAHSVTGGGCNTGGMNQSRYHNHTLSDSSFNMMAFRRDTSAARYRFSRESLDMWNFASESKDDILSFTYTSTFDGEHSHWVPDHSHSVSSSAPGIHNATATNQSAGGGAAHNNMQPYAAVKKIIRAL